MKVLLINPWEQDALPPPSIGYLQAALKHYGVDVIARNLNEAEGEFDIVGVTFHSFSVKYARQIRDKFKCHMVCGGHHPSALPHQMLSIGYDQVVIGEGENAIIDIVKGNRDKIVSVSNKYFSDINDIPFPDYTGLPHNGLFGINIISSRGCPYSCHFCASSDFWGHKYKARSSENVIAEIHQRKLEGYGTWIFEDDNFTANKKRVFEICSQLDGSYSWTTVGRAESMDEELCKELYRAGCRKIFFGIESFSQTALDRMGKNTTVEKMLRGIEIAERYGIETISLFLVGLPGDTLKEVQETHRVRLKSKVKSYGVNIAWLLPGTDIFQKAKERGFNESVYLESGAPFYTYEHSLETLQQWSQQI